MSIPCVFITGSSGTGKSTLLHRCLQTNWPGQLETRVPIKLATRALRSVEEAAELESISPSEFQRIITADDFQLHYENYGVRYGLARREFYSPDQSAVYLQALPTFVALKLRQSLASIWDVRICLLRADEEVVKQRLSKRNSPKNEKYFTQRVQGAKFDFSKDADFVISTNTSPEDVYSRFYRWMLASFDFDDRCLEPKVELRTHTPIANENSRSRPIS